MTVPRLAEIRLQASDRGLGMGWFYALSLYLSRCSALSYFDLILRDLDRVPRMGPALIAATHQSFLDPWLVGLCMERRLCFLARDSLFRVPVLGWLLRQYDGLPVARETAASRGSLDVCLQALAKQRAVLLFPEGTRTRDGRIAPLKRGISLLAKRSRAPVIPVLVRGTYQLWPRTARLPRRGVVEISFGRPLTYGDGESADRFMERLASAYVGLATETGAVEVLPQGPPPIASPVVEGSVSLPAHQGEPEPLAQAAAEPVSAAQPLAETAR
jgi:1-acyl-sn-glycerol-3-phosphate acyltransferase